ncbi:MAG: hypothetical protein ABSA76_08510 [Bacteroidales bacterium]
MLIIIKFASTIDGFVLLIKLSHNFIRGKAGIVSGVNQADQSIYNSISLVQKNKDTTFIVFKSTIKTKMYV